MTRIILGVFDSVFRKTLLPNLVVRAQFLFDTKGKSPLDKLHRFFQRDERGRRKKKMEMVAHHHEFVERKALLAPILAQDVKKQLAVRL